MISFATSVVVLELIYFTVPTKTGRSKEWGIESNSSITKKHIVFHMKKDLFWNYSQFPLFSRYFVYTTFFHLLILLFHSQFTFSVFSHTHDTTVFLAVSMQCSSSLATRCTMCKKNAAAFL